MRLRQAREDNHGEADSSGLDFIPPLTTELPESTPLVVVCYGTAGSTSESYVQQLAAAVCRPHAEGGLSGRVAIVNVGLAMLPPVSR